MSQLAPGLATCPGCGATESCTLFSSIDADTIPVQVEAILEGTFEQRTCPACGAGYRPEHPMLFVSHARRLWIVMHPMADRREFASLELAVAGEIAAELARAAPIVAERSRGIRPRLVFGQHMLTEAVRSAWSGVDAALLECAKLLNFRRNVQPLMAWGPSEFAFAAFADNGAAICEVRALPGGARLGEIRLPNDILAEVQAIRAELRTRFPELFERAYVSATRYLVGDAL
ncbi:MAG: hypothetical protein KF773_08860 [Deltaproteobacteria bacterium]|nr:hypothetical protein [Deltaproteobacteria bacterium]